jgi:pimeloyl-ACP methyl ester carboxylesterase
VVVVDGAFQHRAIDAGGAIVAGRLAPRFTVIRYDRRGRGDSADTLPYAVEREIEDVAALIDEAGGSAALYGMSSGAVLALRAAEAGLPIDRLALWEPPFIVDRSRPLPGGDLAERLAALASKGRRADAVELFMTEAIGLPTEMAAGMRGAPVWPMLEGVAHTLAYDTEVMRGTQTGTPEPLRRWASLTVPTLVLDGGASPGWAREAVAVLVSVLPNADHRTLAGQTHDVQPDVVAPVLEEFLAREDVSARGKGGAR